MLTLAFNIPCKFQLKLSCIILEKVKPWKIASRDCRFLNRWAPTCTCLQIKELNFFNNFEVTWFTILFRNAWIHWFCNIITHKYMCIYVHMSGVWFDNSKKSWKMDSGPGSPFGQEDKAPWTSWMFNFGGFTDSPHLQETRGLDTIQATSLFPWWLLLFFQEHFEAKKDL